MAAFSRASGRARRRRNSSTIVLTRITVIGAIYLAVVCLIPECRGRQIQPSFSLGGTSILIVVSVTMDTVAQIQSHLIAQQYEGLIKKSKLQGARR